MSDSSALVGGNIHKLGKDWIRKSLKVAGEGSILEDIFLPILEKCILFFTMVLISKVSIVGFCTYFAFTWILQPNRTFRNRQGAFSATVSVTLHLTAKEKKGVPNVERSIAGLCTATENKCPSCRGNHSANDRSCPRYKCEEKVLKIKSTNNITCAEAVKQYRGSISSTASPRVSSRSEFPLFNTRSYFQPNSSPQIKPFQRYWLSAT